MPDEYDSSEFPESERPSTNESAPPSVTSSKQRNYSEVSKIPNDLVIILDGWKDCKYDDKYVCMPPEKDIRYDMSQLSILQALPVSLPYSEVGLLDHKTDVTQLSFKRVTTAPKVQRPVPVVKQTVKGSPIQHFAPKSSIRRTSYGKTRVSRVSLPKSDVNCPIVIFHDLYRSQTEWQAFAADLATLLKEKVIVVDLRNHGTSPTATTHCGIAEFLIDFKFLFKELRFDEPKFTLIGHGIGGWSVMIFALLYPYKVKNIVVVEASISDNDSFANEILQLEAALNHVQTPPRGRALSNIKIKLNEFLKDSTRNINLSAYAVQNIIINDVIGRPERWNLKKKELIASLNSFTKFPTFLKLYTFDKPSLFIASKQSKTLQTKDEPEVLKLFPQAKFIYYEKATKNPHVDLYEEFLALVKDYLEKN